jgi:hypothetical protein
MTDAARRQLLRAGAPLGADELRVLVLIAGRLAEGRGVYGELRLKRDRRDFVRETVEEILDALSYCGMALVQRTPRRRRGAGTGAVGAARGPAGRPAPRRRRSAPN